MNLGTAKKGLMLILLFLTTGFSSLLMAAQGQGSIITKISAQQRGADLELIVAGEIDIAQFSSITIKKQGNNQSIIRIPDAVIDPENISQQILQFPETSYLEKIQIQENVEEMQNGHNFIIELVVTTRKPLTGRLAENSSESSMVFAFTDASSTKSSASTATQQTQNTSDTMEQKSQEPATLAPVIQKIYRKPSLMRVAILNASGFPKRAFKLSVFLDHLKKKTIESSLGVRFHVINISNATLFNFDKTTIYYRENHLKSALFLAKLIPGDQRLAKLIDPDRKTGVDLEIYLGKDYK